MNLVQYITEMMNRGTLYSTICVYVLFGLMAFVVIGMLRGLARGAYRQLAHTITFLIAAVLSFVGVKFMIGFLVDWIDVNTVGETFEKVEAALGVDLSEIYAIVLDIGVDTLEGILILPATIILAPIVFIILFFALRLVLGIVRLFVFRNSKIKEPEGILERLGGLCLAGVEAILLVSILILPFTSVARFVEDAYTVIVSDDDEAAAELSEQYVEKIMPLTQHPAVDIASRSANSLIYTSFSESSEAVDAKNDIIYTVKIATLDLPKLLSIDINNISDSDKELIDRTIGDVEHSEFVTSVIASVVKSFARSFTEETKSSLPAPFDTILGDLFTVFTDSGKETVVEDLGLIKDLLVFMSDNHIMAAMASGNDLISVFTAKNPETETVIINDLIELIKANERTKHLVTSITKISISMLADTLSAGCDQLSSVYDSIKGDVSGLLNLNEADFSSSEEYLAALTSNLGESLANNGIALSDEIVGSIADYIDTNLSGNTELTEEEFNDIILSYYSAHIDQFGNGSIPDSFSGNGFSGLGDLIGGSSSGASNGISNGAESESFDKIENDSDGEAEEGNDGMTSDELQDTINNALGGDYEDILNGWKPQ